jgi:hypothetical protein
MFLQRIFHALVVFGPISGLMLVGLVVTIRSGLSSSPQDQTVRRMLANATQLAGALVVCLICLALLQAAVGFNLALVW